MLRREDTRVGFGVTLLPNALDEFLSWCRTAEDNGFDTIGVGDSQSLYREVFITAALCAQETKRVKFGPRVINPMTRHQTLHVLFPRQIEDRVSPTQILLASGLRNQRDHFLST